MKKPPANQKWKDWSDPKYQHLTVTRGELISLLVSFKQQLSEDTWWAKLKRWLALGWLPKRKTGIGVKS